MSRYLPPLSEAGTRWVRFIALLVALVLLIWMLLSLRTVFTPILAALAIAYILNPLVTWCERRRLNRLLVIAALYFVGTILLLVLGVFLVATTIDQTINLRNSIADYLDVAQQWLVLRAQPVTEAGGTQPASTPASAAAAAWWNQLAPLAREHGVAIANSALGILTSTVTSVLNWVTLFVLLPMYTFVFLWKFNDIVAAIRDHLPAGARDSVIYLATTTDRAIASFFRGRLLICLVVGLLTGLGWTLVGVPFGLLLGALTGVLNLVPFMSLVALPLALVAAYLDAARADVSWLNPVLLAMVVYMVVQALESFVLTPTIQARSAGLHPVTTVVALLIGGQWAGLLGMLLAIPIASTLKTLAVELALPEVRQLAGRPPPSETPASGADDRPDEGARPTP